MSRASDDRTEALEAVAKAARALSDQPFFGDPSTCICDAIDYHGPGPCNACMEKALVIAIARLDATKPAEDAPTPDDIDSFVREGQKPITRCGDYKPAEDALPTDPTPGYSHDPDCDVCEDAEDAPKCEHGIEQGNPCEGCHPFAATHYPDAPQEQERPRLPEMQLVRDVLDTVIDDEWYYPAERLEAAARLLKPQEQEPDDATVERVADAIANVLREGVMRSSVQLAFWDRKMECDIARAAIAALPSGEVEKARVSGLRLERLGDNSVRLSMEFATGYMHHIATIPPDGASWWGQWKCVEIAVQAARRAYAAEAAAETSSGGSADAARPTNEVSEGGG